MTTKPTANQLREARFKLKKVVPTESIIYNGMLVMCAYYWCVDYQRYVFAEKTMGAIDSEKSWENAIQWRRSLKYDKLPFQCRLVW